VYAYQSPPPFPPSPPAAERIRLAWQRRHETDREIHFWSSLGLAFITCGIWGFVVFYQLVQRSREHNRRRLELLSAANEFAWQRATTAGLADELRPNFERVSVNLGVMQSMTTDFRDPVVWLVLAIVGSTIAEVVAFVLLDGDLIRHDRAEGAVEADLAMIYTRLGMPLPQPDPARVKREHNYVGRVLASIFSFGLYLLWWWHDIIEDMNRHFLHNWPWEDALAYGVQRLLAGETGSLPPT
jgi:hypothetical protein